MLKQTMDKEKQIVANQIGYLVLLDGAVLESGGELKNDERSANVITGLLNLTESIDKDFMDNSGCERITIDYDNYYYSICMSNRRILVLKLSKTQNGASGGNTMSGSSSATNVYSEASSNTTIDGSGSIAMA